MLYTVWTPGRVTMLYTVGLSMLLCDKETAHFIS